MSEPKKEIILNCDTLFLIFGAIEKRMSDLEKAHWDLLPYADSEYKIFQNMDKHAQDLEIAKKKLGRLYEAQFEPTSTVPKPLPQYVPHNQRQAVPYKIRKKK